MSKDEIVLDDDKINEVMDGHVSEIYGMTEDEARGVIDRVLNYAQAEMKEKLAYIYDSANEEETGIQLLAAHQYAVEKTGATICAALIAAGIRTIFASIAAGRKMRKPDAQIACETRTHEIINETVAECIKHNSEMLSNPGQVVH